MADARICELLLSHDQQHDAEQPPEPPKGAKKQSVDVYIKGVPLIVYVKFQEDEKNWYEAEVISTQPSLYMVRVTLTGITEGHKKDFSKHIDYIRPMNPEHFHDISAMDQDDITKTVE